MHLLIAENAHATYAQLLGQTHPEWRVHGSDDLDQLQAMAGEASVWLGQPDLLAGLLQRVPAPRWVQSTWAGITPLLADGVPRGYRLSRAVGIFGQVMAEYTLTYLLNHLRQVQSRLHSQALGQWDGRQNISLRGQTLLIVGCGEIGQQVAEFLSPFGLRMHGIASQARQQPPFLQVSGVETLAQQVAQADYVLNLLPDTPATHDLYDAALLRRFKPGALFINAGRGAAVVDADLVEVLGQGHLAGAVIDVCRQEPLPGGHPFWTTPRLLLTGHSSAPTSPPAMTALFLENLQAYQAGQPLRGEVDFQRGY